MAKVVPLINHEHEARAAFQAHTQSVAFQLSLSRRMIDALQVVRDYGFPVQAHTKENMAERNEMEKDIFTYPNGSHQFYNVMGSLKSRGLVIHNQFKWSEIGKRVFTLSHAGELTCQLLVEAGLMAAEPVKAKRKVK